MPLFLATRASASSGFASIGVVFILLVLFYSMFQHYCSSFWLFNPLFGNKLISPFSNFNLINLPNLVDHE